MMTVDEKLAQIVADIDAARDETDLDAIAETVLEAIGSVRDAMDVCESAADEANRACSLLDEAVANLSHVEGLLTDAFNRG